MDDALPAAAQAAGWTVADVRWEALQEEAARLHLAGDVAAAEHWGEALQLAKQHFAATDPRLACSLANAARGQPQDEQGLLDAARVIWEQSPLWVDGIALPSRARSSLHHFRMERRHRVTYQNQARRHLHEAAAQARALFAGEVRQSTAQQLAQWEKEKPPLFDDSRKLLAACLLLAGNDD